METVRQHLISRHIDFALHRPIIDDNERVATFFLWNLSGGIVGYQQYRPDAGKEKRNNPKEGRYFTFHPKKTIAVWGLESLHLTPNILFVTEGIFDAARITERGVSAIAVLSNDPTNYVKTWINCLSRKVIAVCDDDAAGRKLAKLGDESIVLSGHDLGDATDEEVTELIAKFY